MIQTSLRRTDAGADSGEIISLLTVRDGRPTKVFSSNLFFASRNQIIGLLVALAVSPRVSTVTGTKMYVAEMVVYLTCLRAAAALAAPAGTIKPI